jgi:NAD(P)-dependent dehydrogenase (short-subunit alcohol dehydrogenase family)
MKRTIVITGAASGIGAATTRRLQADGHRVIGVDLRGADVDADLGTIDGRAKMLEAVTRLAPEGIDGVVAGAGIARADAARETIAINFFGAIATLEGLRPLLSGSSHPRAVAICSTATMLPGDPAVVEACLALDEPAALRNAAASPDTAYQDSKRALSLWLRRAAARSEWAGLGILLNGVAPGVTNTPMTAPQLANPDMGPILAQTNPLAVKSYAEPAEVAEIIGYLLAFECASLLGQIVYVDGGSDAILRPDHV